MINLTTEALMVYILIFLVAISSPVTVAAQNWFDTVHWVSGLMDQHVQSQADPVLAGIDRGKANAIQSRLGAAAVLLNNLDALDQELIILTRQHYHDLQTEIAQIRTAGSSARQTAAAAKLNLALRQQAAIMKLNYAAREHAVAAFRAALVEAEQLIGREVWR